MGNVTIPETLYDGSLFTKKLMSNLNFVNDKIWVSADAPALPFPGQMWWDSDASTLSVWTGAVWYQIYPASVGGTLVKISGNDTTANYLGVKLVSGTGVILTELYNGEDERLEVKIGQAVGITDSPVFAGLTINGNIIVSGTVDGLDLQMHNHGGPNQGEAVDHINLINKGSNTHPQIDTHIATGNIHFLESSISHLNIQNRGTNTHAQIDLHIANTSNPHSVTYTQVGAIQNANDTVKDTHIDWGLGTNQVSAVDIPISDAGGYYTSTDVEGALQEIGASGGGGYWTRNTGNGYLYPSTLTDKVGVGTQVPDQMLDVKGKFQIWDEGPNVGLIYIKSNYQSNGCGGISIWRSRGTKASPSNLLPEDYVGVIEFKPYYSNNWLNSADILVQVLSPALSGSPSRMRFRTVRDGDMVPDEKFRIEPNSVVFNYEKGSYDFEIKGDNYDYVFYVDASVDKVGIGLNNPDYMLTIKGLTDNSVLKLVSSTGVLMGIINTSSSYPFMNLYSTDGSTIKVHLDTNGQSYFSGGRLSVYSAADVNILQIETGDTWDSASADDELIIVKGPSAQASTGGYFGIRLRDGAYAEKAAGIYAVSESQWSNAIGIAFYTWNNSAYAERVRITNSGYVKMPYGLEVMDNTVVNQAEYRFSGQSFTLEGINSDDHLPYLEFRDNSTVRACYLGWGSKSGKYLNWLWENGYWLYVSGAMPRSSVNWGLQTDDGAREYMNMMYLGGPSGWTITENNAQAKTWYKTTYIGKNLASGTERIHVFFNGWYFALGFITGNYSQGCWYANYNSSTGYVDIYARFACDGGSIGSPSFTVIVAVWGRN